jgi:glutamate-1-semialdehyde 2,1-aminomutase
MRRNSFERSKEHMRAASACLAGGVSSNFRLGMRPTPLLIRRGEGPYLTDADGNRLIDYYLGMGPMLLGHNPPRVIAAARRQLEDGILFAGQTAVEYEAARRLCELVPCAERIRFGGSGTEVIQAALRLARAATGRHVVIKFEGHYHGWLDNVFWSVGPAANACGPKERPHRVAGTLGCDSRAAENLEVVGWNDLSMLEQRLSVCDVAAVIMEPVMCNGGTIPPRPGYLAGAREACRRTGTLLIFDEIITGFRLAAGGAQQVFGVTPDLATFGKALASGFPVAAVAGRAELLDLLVTGGVMHGGTYNAHPVSMAATLATLEILGEGAIYPQIEQRGRRLMEALRETFARHGIPARVQGFPAMFHVAFGRNAPIETYRDTLATDRVRYAEFAATLLELGVRVLERGTWFLSSEHDDEVIDKTLEAVDIAARTVS